MFIWIEHVITVFFFIGLFCMMYGYFIEPHLIEVSHHKLHHSSTHKKVISLVQITDVHLGDFMSLKRLDHLINHVNALQPDVVMITGDLLDNARKYKELDQVKESLLRIHPSAKKVAVYGNHEYAGSGEKEYKNILESSGFKLLVNESTTLDMKGLQLQMSGTDCQIYGIRDYEFIKGFDSSLFSVLMLHQPDTVDHYLHAPIDLVVSGHTHNGQIKLPLVGTIILPELGKLFVEGWFKHSKRTSHYVCRGLGMTMLPFRFKSRPEIAVFDVEF
jgi:predicted MPP superfamily phosphohydrolase